MSKNFFRNLLDLRGHKLPFFLCAMICGFCICAEYAVVRPVSTSVFLYFHGSEKLAYAWLLAVPLNLLCVTLYNFAVQRMGYLITFFVTVGLVGGGNWIFSYLLVQSPASAFFFYLWKDIYILLMFQQLWAVIHSVASKENAKSLYGVLFGVGALGSVLGSMVPAFFAVKTGSEILLKTSLPIYLSLSAAFYAMFHYAKTLGFSLDTTEDDSLKRGEKSKFARGVSAWESLQKGIRLILHSRALFTILLLVLSMQIASTLIDFQFQKFLEIEIPEKDIRTAFGGKMFGWINLATLLMQFFGSYLIIYLFGIRGAHLFIPILLGVHLGCFGFFMTFEIITLCFMSMKVLDFSLFSILKEMLYVPLRTEEKVYAKSMIDVFAYRSARAVASLILLALAPLLQKSSWPIFSVLTLLLLLWGWVIVVMFREPFPTLKTYETTKG